MSYDIFFVRRDPGQTMEDALADLEESYEGGDPGPLTDDDLEQWEALLPAAREILGPTAELTQDDDETRELDRPGQRDRPDARQRRAADPRAGAPGHG